MKPPAPPNNQAQQQQQQQQPYQQQQRQQQRQGEASKPSQRASASDVGDGDDHNVVGPTLTSTSTPTAATTSSSYSSSSYSYSTSSYSSSSVSASASASASNVANTSTGGGGVSGGASIDHCNSSLKTLADKSDTRGQVANKLDDLQQAHIEATSSLVRLKQTKVIPSTSTQIETRSKATTQFSVSSCSASSANQLNELASSPKLFPKLTDSSRKTLHTRTPTTTTTTTTTPITTTATQRLPKQEQAAIDHRRPITSVCQIKRTSSEQKAKEINQNELSACGLGDNQCSFIDCANSQPGEGRFPVQACNLELGNEQSFASNSNNFLLWNFLSNLPKSITQRNTNKTPVALASVLTPEVVGYINRRNNNNISTTLVGETGAQLSSGNSIEHLPAHVNQSAASVDQRERQARQFNAVTATQSYYDSAAKRDKINQAPLAKSIEMSELNQQQFSPEGQRLITIVEPQFPNGSNEEPTQQRKRTTEDQQSSSSRQPTEMTDCTIETGTSNDDNQQQQQPYRHHHHHHHQHHHHNADQFKSQSQQQNTKLSITTTTTTTTTTNTATTTRSSASSLSSCILSESSSTSEVRLKWGKKMDFLLSIIGFAVDLANIWRFPYLVYKNGGGVFLIPYLTMLIFGGIPLFFLELCLGQFVKKGPITVWNKICPSMKGVGYCSILISWYVSFYYNVLIAWSVYFIYRSLLSFGDKMPWEDCDNIWNTPSTCVSISQLKSQCATTNDTLENCRRTLFGNDNVTSPASEFFVKELSQIDQSTGLDDMGSLRIELVLCTMVVYLLHYFSLFRGLETSGKVVWVTATAPYMILSILLVRGLFLPGATMGIEYYLSPKLDRLADPQVWIDAAGQVFYSIGVGFGVHLTYASFNSHNNNCYRDCLTTSAVNAATSVYSGLVVFVYLGYMAQNLGIEIDKVASEGYSLVFEVYPEALTTLPFARFWSILFFIMLLTLGIDSAMGGLEAVITGLEDEFKFARRLSRAQLTGLVIFSSFLPALISCTQGGAYTLFWFDIYSAGVSLLFSALFETIGVVYCYGIDKFILNIESMLNRKPHLFYILCWKYISPTFLGVVIFMSIYTAGVPTYRGYTFPMWSIILGWCLAFSSVAAVPIVAFWTWFSNYKKKLAVLNGKANKKTGRDRGGSSCATDGSGKHSRKSPNHKTLSVRCIDQAQGGTTRTTCTTSQTPLTTTANTSSPQNNKDRNLIRMGEDML